MKDAWELHSNSYRSLFLLISHHGLLYSNQFLQYQNYMNSLSISLAEKFKIYLFSLFCTKVYKITDLVDLYL